MLKFGVMRNRRVREGSGPRAGKDRSHGLFYLQIYLRAELSN
jgi:hypothetical protein